MDTLVPTLREQGRTVAWLARQLGVSRTSVYLWSSGARSPRPHRARLIEGLLGLPPRSLGRPAVVPPMQAPCQEATP